MIIAPRTKLTTLPVCDSHAMVIDGPLGGCGLGDVGDPRTYLPEVWRDVVESYGITSVLDVGCGFGYSTKWFQDNGCDAHGLEGSEGIAERAASVAENISCHDFRHGKPPLDEFDLCWCSEFLEHVEAHHWPCILAAFANCRYVLMTAAPPGFAGHNHVNCQTSEYWIERMVSAGFEFLQDETNRLRKLAHERHPGCYFQGTGLLFRRPDPSLMPPVPTHWSEVDGWLLTDEALLLQEVAKGARVLELGAWKGKSTLALASTAKHVVTVDTFRGDADTGEADTLGEFLANVRRSGLHGRIEEVVSTIEAAAPEIRRRRFEVVYIDASHDAESVERDTALAMEALLPGGTILWHDWDYESVRAGVLATGLEEKDIQRCCGIGILRTSRWNAMITLPHSRGVEIQSVKSVRYATIDRFVNRAGEMDMDCGSLTHNFNTLLAQCLAWRDEGRLTHLAMVHSDVSAERGWADLLAEEMHLHSLVAISAVVAIKDPEDDRTSTAIGSKSDPWEPLRYVRRRDMGRLPVTFTGKDVCRGDDEVLLINTGLMLIDLRCEFWDSFAFKVYNRVLVQEDGTRRPQFRPEDWEMSRELEAAGLRYGATWRPLVDHHGCRVWNNRPDEVGILTSGREGGRHAG